MVFTRGRATLATIQGRICTSSLKAVAMAAMPTTFSKPMRPPTKKPSQQNHCDE
jgi:hypothetical protein